MRLPVDLGHTLEVDEVAESQWRQVQPGLLAVACRLDGDAHLCVVGCPRACVVLPLPQPALTRRRRGVVEAAANRSEGTWGNGRKTRVTPQNYREGNKKDLFQKTCQLTTHCHTPIVHNTDNMYYYTKTLH